MISFDPTTIPLHIVLAVVAVAYLIALAVYRLWFSPLSHVPGPKLAAITLWYEFYYDCVLRGQYIFKIEQLHRQYGPILRINPWEIHISDIEFYDEVYAVSNRKRERWAWNIAPGGFIGSMGGTADHDLHRVRRSALAPFFSKSSTRKLQHIIDGRVQFLVASFQRRKGDEPFDIKHAFAALTNATDLVMEYTFGYNVNRVSHKNYDPKFHDNFVAGLSKMSLLRHFPWLDRCARTIPPHLLAPFSPVVAQFWKEKIAITTQAREVMEAGADAIETADHRTIYHDILSSKLPPEEKNLERLAQEAQILLSAGTLATSWIMTVGCYHLLAPGNAEYLNKLHSELRDAIPDPLAENAFELTKLEQLPYLTACVNEMMRLGNGTTTRLQRIAPSETLIFTSRKTKKIYPIPPGTPISISNFLVHRNPDYFSEPSKFNPDRWIENPKLTKYLVAFSKGTRQCIGMHLANAEMYLTIARLFRNYVSLLELYDTTEQDVIIVADLLVPAVFKESKGVRLRVVS
ncbi:hypothetical protein OIDMADRAFT_133134 [Oidiodendron maius Zn]|uniref:Cytochrome P450 n=1 Tax=Oidiodendron maius (strain Zn) TaxID=913774 RepID=A0A0C3GXU0_OIDMZ|nr:hypothetical protein OIDMADRAFT_133134 [Oidiodendron maius Zn]